LTVLTVVFCIAQGIAMLWFAFPARFGCTYELAGGLAAFPLAAGTDGAAAGAMATEPPMRAGLS